MLPAPMEILEIPDGKSATFRVTHFQLDDAIIKPAHAPQGKAIKVLRVHVPPNEKPTPPYYWDITGLGAQAQLLPFLEQQNFGSKRFTLHAIGEAPKKRFRLEVT